jgi:hypothetical protein
VSQARRRTLLADPIVDDTTSVIRARTSKMRQSDRAGIAKAPAIGM